MKKSARFFLVFIIMCGAPVKSANLWEFLIGPRLGPDTGGGDGGGEESNQRTTEQIVRSYGYRLDTHLVASETGHILTLHRISKGRRKENKDKPVAFIHHGLFGCSDMWLLRGPRKDLPYILTDSGYDVWLSNTRGNVYSRKHKFLNPDQDPQYWNFGIEEIGYFDLPVTIDYILNITNQKNLTFLGHSVGSSTGFIMCSLRPEYNKKIRLFLALGPLTNVRHTLSPLHKILFLLASVLIKYTESMNVQEILPRRSHISEILAMACENGSPLQKVCLSTIFSVVGDDISQLNTKTFPQFLRYYPSGTSLKVTADVIRYYLSGEFARSDSLKNNSSITPFYDLKKVTVPVSLYYGPGDLLVTEDDVSDLSRRLPNSIGMFKVPYEQFSHLDFVLAMNANILLYDRLLQVMEKYR